MKKRLLLRRNIILFIVSLNLFASEVNFADLEKEKDSLINSYFIRIDIARQENLQDRVLLLDKTLNCLINSKSKKDIIDCKVDERKRILNLIKG